MLVQIPNVLDADSVARLRAALNAPDSPWVDGRQTAGYQGAAVKRNQQLDEHSKLRHELGDIVLAAFERNQRFIAAVLPNRAYTPLFNRYQGGMDFGPHVDGGVRLMPGTPFKIRTDVSITLFLSEPDEYDGGELCIEDTYGAHEVKLPAGHAVVYPGTSVHHVRPVTRGVRLGSFFWAQSLVRSDGHRTLLYDLDNAIQRLNATQADADACRTLVGTYHNLLRAWSET